jgi:hypothetical protein
MAFLDWYQQIRVHSDLYSNPDLAMQTCKERVVQLCGQNISSHLGTRVLVKALDFLRDVPLKECKMLHNVTFVMIALAARLDRLPSVRGVFTECERSGMKISIRKAVVDMVVNINRRAATHAESDMPTRPRAVALWQRLIRMQIKINRHDREQTALNVSKRKHRVVRVLKACPFTPTRPSGPRKPTAWVPPSLTLDERAKRESAREAEREAIHENTERKQAEARRQAAIRDEMLRNLRIGVAIGGK